MKQKERERCQWKELHCFLILSLPAVVCSALGSIVGFGAESRGPKMLQRSTAPPSPAPKSTLELEELVLSSELVMEAAEP